LLLAEFQDFSAWCVAERESARKLHARILTTLLDRLHGEPDAAVRHARRLKRIDPYDEAVRARLVRLLAAANRPLEAQEQYRAASRALHDAGIAPTGELLGAWQAVRTAATTPGASEPVPAPEPAQAADSPLVGRDAECALLRGLRDTVIEHRRARGVLLSGEPGVGKSRLLAEFAQATRQRRGIVLQGCCYEAERRRPFAPWVDALRRLPDTLLTASRRDALGPLLPGGGEDGALGRERLFAAVAGVVAQIAAEASVLALCFDDVQWLDDDSAALINYVLRLQRDAPLLLVFAARRGELPDNLAAQGIIQALRREGVLQEQRLRPLSEEQTTRLVAAVAPGSDARRVFHDSAGNPLFAIEVARALARGDTAERQSFQDIVRDRVERLPATAVEVLRWAAVAGPRVRMEVLESVPSVELDTLTAALEVIERHGLLTEISDPDLPRGAYRFAHELVRRVVVSDLSTPRRRLMHLHIAKALQARAGDAGDAAIEIADHAAWGGDAAMAARACIAAARRCLRMFANHQAETLARRGMRHAEALDDPERLMLLLELSQVRLNARRPDDRAQVAAALELLTERALDHGCLKHARLGFYMLSVLRWESGDWDDARRFTIRIEELGRAGSEKERLLAMGTTGQCLVLLERDLPQAEAMLLEAAALGERSGETPAVVLEAQGMLRLHAGDLDEAGRLLHQARAIAQRDGERLGEFGALEYLVVLELQRGRVQEALRLSGEMVAISQRLREGSEAPFARAIQALACLSVGAAVAPGAMDEALDALRQQDAKHRLAFVLNRAAHLALERGEADLAAARAREACATARALDRGSEVILALATLARIAGARGDTQELRRCHAEIGRCDLARASAQARRAAAELPSMPARAQRN
jgi:tetratricopeptide (TPR) repeat protein